jgi:two-component system alkaline phosphatase synthesis response regulator PhoP
MNVTGGERIMMDEKKTILVVDDDPDAIAFAESVISDLGDFNVLTAGDGEIGLTIAIASKPDLIILDVTMPVKNGFETFNDLRKSDELKDTPVIMLTGIAHDSGIAFRGKDMGHYFGKEPAAFIDKPVDPEKLQQEITKIFGIK